MFGRTYSNLGPVVGQINGEDIRANQLERRGYDWENGYGTPSDGQDTNRDGQPVRKLTKDAKSHNIDWTFVGPENVLCAGITDKFEKAGQKIFGPNQRASQLEGSKDYALRFMSKYNIPTARYETFTSAETCIAGLKDFTYPVVIKEDGLAGGKGVTIAKNQDVAEETIREMFAGGQTAVVLEECLVGPEYSMFVVVSEDQFTILPMAQDHKRVGDGDKGPNTGGMGSYSPLPQLKKEDRQRMIDEIVKPTMNGLVQGGYHYCGVLYIGLMLTEDGPKVIEYNVRLGDPETQVVLPRVKNDFAQVIDAAVNHEKLPEIEENNSSILGVVVCSKGYPTHPAPNVKIGKLPHGTNTYIDYANVKGDLDNLTGDGGRLFMVISEADNLVQAQDNVYSYLSKLDLPDCFYRHDIGNRALRDQMFEKFEYN